MPSTLISCLMVTKPAPERLKLLATTLEDFRRQTHARRELVVVVDAPNDAAASPVLRTISESGVEPVRTIVAGGSMTLGALRNLCWAASAGDVVCAWDDDDRHHPERLATQWAALRESGRSACYLQEILHFFALERRIYSVNFRPAPDPVAVNTPMCRRDVSVRYPETGAEATLGEDTALFRRLQAVDEPHALAGAAPLFVYVHHGANTCSAAHHRQLVDFMGASRGLLVRQEAGIRAALAALGVGDVIVTGRNGDAFVVSGTHSDATETVSL